MKGIALAILESLIRTTFVIAERQKKQNSFWNYVGTLLLKRRRKMRGLDFIFAVVVLLILLLVMLKLMGQI